MRSHSARASIVQISPGHASAAPIWFSASFENARLDRAEMEFALMANAVLRHARLAEADMSGAQLDRAVMTGADLRKTNLRGAGLRDSQLDEADLRNARLGGAFLAGASLRGADLRGAYLRSAKLDGADLSDANLEGAEGITQAQLDSVGACAAPRQCRAYGAFRSKIVAWQIRICRDLPSPGWPIFQAGRPPACCPRRKSRRCWPAHHIVFLTAPFRDRTRRLAGR